jgi:hypothetical protein
MVLNYNLTLSNDTIAMYVTGRLSLSYLCADDIHRQGVGIIVSRSRRRGQRFPLYLCGLQLILPRAFDPIEPPYCRTNGSHLVWDRTAALVTFWEMTPQGTAGVRSTHGKMCVSPSFFFTYAHILCTHL